jgi:hypothetical protein
MGHPGIVDADNPNSIGPKTLRKSLNEQCYKVYTGPLVVNRRLDKFTSKDPLLASQEIWNYSIPGILSVLPLPAAKTCHHA